MFPKSRRCLTGTPARPSVTARTSRPHFLVNSQPWSRYESRVSSLLFPGATTDPAPRDNLVEDSNNRPDREQQAAYLPIRKLLSHRTGNQPRASVDSTKASPRLRSARSDNVPNSEIARKALASQAKARQMQHEQPEDQHVPEPKKFGRQAVDWLPIARILANIPLPKIPSLDSGPTPDSVQLDRHQMRLYTGSYRPNAWVEAAGAGVHVELHTELSGDTTTRPAVLEGSPVYVAAAREKLSRFVDLGSDPDELPDAASLGDVLASVDSVSAFSRFVYRLTNHHVNRSVEKEMTGNYNRYAADLLSNAFSDPSISAHASTVALNRALLFLHNHPDLLDAANLVYAHGSRMALVQNITTCNIRLGYALKHSILHLAHATVLEMTESRIQPNGHTWSMIYAAARTTELRKQVVQLKRQLEAPMNAQAWSRVASTMVEEQLEAASDSAKLMASIMKQFDKTLGVDWLSASTVHKILHMCKERNLVHVARYTQEAAHKRGVIRLKNTHVYEFALLHRQRKLRLAIELFVSMVANRDPVYLKLVIPRIFMTAWAAKRINVCCVLWIFATTHGLITHTMHSVVRKYLYPSSELARRQLASQSEPVRKRSAWRHLAARIIVWVEGGPTRRADVARHFPRLHAYTSPTDHSSRSVFPIDMLNQWTPNDGTRSEQVQLLLDLLRCDLNAWKTLQPMELETLAQHLSEAHKKDNEWYASGYLNDIGNKNVAEVRRKCWETIGYVPSIISEDREARISRIRRSVKQNIEDWSLESREPKEKLKIFAASAPDTNPARPSEVQSTASKQNMYEVIDV